MPVQLCTGSTLRSRSLDRRPFGPPGQIRAGSLDDGVRSAEASAHLTLYFVRHWSQSGELGSGDQGWRDPQRVFESVLGWSSASLLGLGVVTLLAAIGFG